jgi:hypothetical protein
VRRRPLTRIAIIAAGSGGQVGTAERRDRRTIDRSLTRSDGPALCTGARLHRACSLWSGDARSSPRSRPRRQAEFHALRRRVAGVEGRTPLFSGEVLHWTLRHTSWGITDETTSPSSTRPECLVRRQILAPTNNPTHPNLKIDQRIVERDQNEQHTERQKLERQNDPCRCPR